jgi:hypothetical protein
MNTINEIVAISCDECQGAGFLFYENENDFDVMSCGCIPDDEDFTEMIWGA